MRLLRGRAELGPVGDIVAESGAAQRRYYGEQQGNSNIEEMSSAGVRPTWVGTLDFGTRLPGGMA